MKPNTQKLWSVPCDKEGRLTLVGVVGTTATFMAENLRLVDAEVFKQCLFEGLDMELNGNSSIIVTFPLNNPRGLLTSVVFQCDFQGELRNPRGLLKCIRTQLHRIIELSMSADREDDWEDRFDFYDEIPEGEDFVRYCPDCGRVSGECTCM
jgi:hypothetical protein